ncbi:MAG: N-6 DNA methylase [Hyphomicrobiales bacterium]|nr:N-6 DNA methylase [Hyphomicrobiales bacterium]
MSLVEPGPSADHGEVFTRRWVVEFILDLVGYTPDRDLGAHVLVEPSCGTGAFLGPIVDRLIESARQHGRSLAELRGAVRGFDLLDANAATARRTVSGQLAEAGLGHDLAEDLAAAWVTTADFLLSDHELVSADYVVGNPPYVRLESVPGDRMAAYRAICPTMRGRADIYVGFIERGLSLLRSEGMLGFICADRWMRNQYGARLRELVTTNHAVDAVVSMHDVDAFEDDVSAYPAVVVIRNGNPNRTRVVDASAGFGEPDAAKVANWARRPRSRRASGSTFSASRLERWFEGTDLWPAGTPDQLATIADLEARFQPLEGLNTGTRVGIGVATGCDEVFITRDDGVVEEDRLLPLLQARNTASGHVEWAGEYLINPWDERGLVDLEDSPRLAAYYEENARRLKARHVAKKQPARWYRTIDRVNPLLQERPKLVLPDMKAAAHPVLDEGGFYPHHNLYFVISDQWDLEVLGGLLMSDVTNLFVGSYCVKMRGGTYRFQAQYLRRIRVPDPNSLSLAQRRGLAKAFADRDPETATAVAVAVYDLGPAAVQAIRTMGAAA